jgi:hypothetical protein
MSSDLWMYKSYKDNLRQQFEHGKRVMGWLQPERKIGPKHGPQVPPMTVGDLIERLQCLDPAMVVMFGDPDPEEERMDAVLHVEDGRVYL